MIYEEDSHQYCCLHIPYHVRVVEALIVISVARTNVYRSESILYWRIWNKHLEFPINVKLANIPQAAPEASFGWLDSSLMVIVCILAINSHIRILSVISLSRELGFETISSPAIYVKLYAQPYCWLSKCLFKWGPKYELYSSLVKRKHSYGDGEMGLLEKVSRFHFHIFQKLILRHYIHWEPCGANQLNE